MSKEDKKEIEDELEERIIEEFLEKEKERTAKELEEVQKELREVYDKLARQIEILDVEIQKAYKEGDEALWISLTNKKSLILENLNELVPLLKKQPV